ncbi:MAG: chemotaxis protein CheR [Acuticoccus sp.]
MLHPDDFNYLSQLLKDRSGLALTPDKAYLITTRLKPLLEQHGIRDVSAMVRDMKAGRLRALVDEVVDLMTTNESLFFRDTKPFEALIQTMLPAIAAARGPGRPIRIWCAAASTGQEPYSIAMLLEENAMRFGRRDITILGTDLSNAALGRARAGEYTAFEVGRGIPPDMLAKYFTKGPNNHHIVADRIRSRVTYKPRNLLDEFTSLGQFDIIFCRNVLIYFDRPTKADVLNRMARVLASDGYLVLGGPETTLGLSDSFERHPDWRNVYIRTKETLGQTLDGLCA